MKRFKITPGTESSLETSSGDSKVAAPAKKQLVLAERNANDTLKMCGEGLRATLITTQAPLAGIPLRQ